MIEKIIKRDGSIEDFQPNKLNRWAEWASNEVTDYVDWSDVVCQVSAGLSGTVSSDDLQEKLIGLCIDKCTWSYGLMAGSLYGPLLHRRVFPEGLPTLKDLHDKLYNLGLMIDLSFYYNDVDYNILNNVLTHEADFHTPYSALKQINDKYTLKNRTTKTVYETQQFVYMRTAMGLCIKVPDDERVAKVIDHYIAFKNKKVSLPSPMLTNAGTPLRAYASCCLYLAGDTANSLSVGDHIAYMMTVRSAGIGCLINSRSIGDPVRGGSIEHQGKLPYFKSLGGAVGANLQNGRGGACTTYFSCFDPEVKTIIQLKNPMSVEAKRNRDLDYAMIVNKFFARKVAKLEEIFLFNIKTAPALVEAFFSGDEELFESIYEELESNVMFHKEYVCAREVLIASINESFETGRQYLFWIDEANRHTPFLDTIYSSNLCLEISLPTKEYVSIQDLYSSEDHGRGEIALCSLSAINVYLVNTYEEYSKNMRVALEALDESIHSSEYPFPHLEVTAKKRLSVGMGMIGLAHRLASLGLSYATVEGKKEIHRLAELHMYTAIEQSLILSIKKGLCPGTEDTKWKDGWLPIDTYNRKVDSIADFKLEMDWEGLRSRIIANGGIRNSALIAYMPSESSSKAAGETNAIYPIRDYDLSKSDSGSVIEWTAPDGDRLEGKYDIAWDVPTKDMIDVYAIIQKFTDQTISADLFRKLISDESIGSKEMISNFLYMTKMGLKSRYYQNTKTTDGGYLSHNSETAMTCAGGSCKL